MSKKQGHDLTIDGVISNLRWAWLLIALAIIILKPPASDQDLTLIYLILGVGVVYNLLVVALLFIGWYPNWLATTVIIFDVALSIALMVKTGGHESFMLPVLLFPVIASVFRLNTESGLLLSALPIGVAYVVSMFNAVIANNGDIQRIPTTKMVADLAVLFGVGILTGYISQKTLQLKTRQDREAIKTLQVENDRAKAIYEMANTLSSTLNYRKVLTAMVDLAQLALSEAGGTQDASVVGMVLLFEKDAPLGKIELVAGRNIPRSDMGTKVSVKEGVLAQAIYKAEAIIASEVHRDPVLKNFIALHNCDSMVCAPLRAGFDIYGLVLFASPQKNIYTREHAALLTTFCNQAIIALQNAQLYQDLEKEQKKLLEKEAQARRELARNLHDGPTQAIAAVAMRLNFVQLVLKREGDIEKSLDELAKVEHIALRATQEIRTMLFTLRPVVLENQGLVAAVEQYADRIRDLDNLNIELETDKYNGELSTEAEGVIFAIIEEAVGNAKKHAKAELIKIRLAAQNVAAQNGFVVAEISDNGVGFDVEAVKSTYDQRGSIGLLNIDERAEMVGGRCFITSAKGKGTKITVEVPVRRQS